MMKPYKTSKADLRDLLKVLEISSYAKRRGELRKLAAKMFERCVDEAWLAELVDLSCLIGEGDQVLDLKPTPRSFLGALDPVAMANVAALGSDGLGLMREAILKPTSLCATSDKSKTGYKFGLHGAMETMEALKVGLKTTIETMEEDVNAEDEGVLAVSIKDMPLDSVIGAMVVASEVTGTDLVSVAGTLMERAATKADGERAFAVHAYVANLTVKERKELMDTPVGEGAALGQALVHMLTEGVASEAEAEAEVTEAEASGVERPSDTEAALIDMALKNAGLGSINSILDKLEEVQKSEAKALRELEDARKAAPTVVEVPKVEASGGMPEGRMTLVRAKEVFGITKGASYFDFDVPVWEWSGPHPDVPAVDDGYRFEPQELMAVLVGLVKNKPTYLHGHTGTGKTSLIEQAAARLNWPVFRLNFDSEVTRVDLLGKDELAKEDGVTVSRFVEGVLPRYMQQGYVMIYDEFDFIRADVSYVMQRVLEKDGLVLTEDRGRLVKPHPMMRIFATGNTVGQGDEHNLYQGARVQSMALLNRFTNWKRIDYLIKEDRLKLIKKAAPALDGSTVATISQYVDEHMEAFMEKHSVTQPISPRDYMSLADQAQTYLAYYPKAVRKDALREAFNTAVLERANTQDKAVLAGIVNRLIA